MLVLFEEFEKPQCRDEDDDGPQIEVNLMYAIEQLVFKGCHRLFFPRPISAASLSPGGRRMGSG